MTQTQVCQHERLDKKIANFWQGCSRPHLIGLDFRVVSEIPSLGIDRTANFA